MNERAAAREARAGGWIRAGGPCRNPTLPRLDPHEETFKTAHLRPRLSRLLERQHE